MRSARVGKERRQPALEPAGDGVPGQLRSELADSRPFWGPGGSVFSNCSSTSYSPTV